jgi:hypothetical protein
MKAISLRRDDRFGDVEEFIYQLETGKLRALPPRRPAPLLQRNPVRLWQGVSLLLVVALAVVMGLKLR